MLLSPAIVERAFAQAKRRSPQGGSEAGRTTAVFREMSGGDFEQGAPIAGGFFIRDLLMYRPRSAR